MYTRKKKQRTPNSNNSKRNEENCFGPVNPWPNHDELCLFGSKRKKKSSNSSNSAPAERKKGGQSSSESCLNGMKESKNYNMSFGCCSKRSHEPLRCHIHCVAVDAALVVVVYFLSNFSLVLIVQSLIPFGFFVYSPFSESCCFFFFLLSLIFFSLYPLHRYQI